MGVKYYTSINELSNAYANGASPDRLDELTKKAEELRVKLESVKSTYQNFISYATS